MAELLIQVAGVDIMEYVQQETIRIESSGSALASTLTFRVKDRLGEARWLQVADKAEVVIEDGATRLFGGRINIPTDEHDGPIRDWLVRASDYTTQLEEHICVNSFFEAGSSDSAMIAAIFAAWCLPIDGVTHVDTLEASMPEMHLNSITIREAMDQICRKTGGMYYVDFYRRLHYFSGDEGVAAPFGLSTEPDMATLFPYERFKRRLNATRIVNNVLVVGNGIEVWREHAASIAHYAFRYQDVIRDSNIQTIAEAEDYGDWYLARYAWPHDEPRLRCRRAGLRAGMNIRLINSVHNIDQTYSIRRAVTRCTGSYEPHSPQYMVDLQLGAQDAPGRPDMEPPRDPPPPKPPPYDPPNEGGTWAQKVYIATQDLGIFYTDDYVTDSRYIAGVPTWTATNTGLNLAFECLGLRGDPFDPENRQYVLMEDGVYRREDGGNWVSVLTLAQAVAITGGDVNPVWNGFGINGLNCNINREGWVGVLFYVHNLAHTAIKTVLLYSTDFGATWAEGIIGDWGSIPLNRYIPYSLTVGAYKGSSPYDAGQVMYCGVTFTTAIAVSTDMGQTWSWGAFLGANIFYGHLLVDPSDQSRLFIGCRDGAGPWHAAVSLDHGATIANYDLNGSEWMGYGTPSASYYHVSVAMDERKTVRIGAQIGLTHIHTTRDDGDTWDEPTPEFSSQYLGISLIQDSPNFLYLLRQVSAPAGPPPSNCQTVWASEDEGRTMIPKSGANACTIDTGGGDSLPYNHGGVRGILEVWTDPERGTIQGYPTDHSLGQHPGAGSWPQIEDMVGTGSEEVAAGSHAAQHENAGADEVNVGGLSGDLADEQDPKGHDHQGVGSDGGKLTGAIVDSYEDFEEIAAPANPPADVARVYSKDDAGTTKLYYRRSDGTELELGVAAGALPAHDHQGVGADGGKLTGAIIDSYVDWEEIAAPANPGVNVARMYSKDDAGTTKLYYRRSDGTEIEIPGTSQTRSVWVHPGGTTANPTDPFQAATGDFLARGAAQNDPVHFNLAVPGDFDTLTKAVAIFIGFNADTTTFDLNTDYGADGEAYNNHSENQVTGAIATVLNQLTEVDVSGVLTGIAAGDYVGLAIDKNSATALLRWIGALIEYTTP